MLVRGPLGTQWHGYADAQPSESIQAHPLPGLAVAVVFPYLPRGQLLKLPVNQYKSYKGRQKSERAQRFAGWLIEQKELGLKLSGFAHAHTQLSAAMLGLELVEELPDTRVEPHYKTFRLFFGDEYIDFAQAIALEYYFFTASFGILRAGMKLPEAHRNLLLFMDRFPGSSTGNSQPGRPVPTTQGEKFITFVRQQSKTGQGMEQNNKSANLRSRWNTLDWWKPPGERRWRKGKLHPHFILPDWLAEAATAQEFRDEFIADFKKERDGISTADSLQELYQAFKSFDIWSMSANTLPHIRGSEKKWAVPDDARKFILARATR